MRRLIFASFAIGAVALASYAGVPLTSAVAHEEDKVECTETSINAMNADLQSMKDGEAKTTAKTEMKMAEEMMAKKDMKGCETHLHNAIEAMEK